MALGNGQYYTAKSKRKGSWPEAILYGLRKTTKPLSQHSRCCNHTSQRQYRLVLTREAASALPQSSTRYQMDCRQLGRRRLIRNKYRNTNRKGVYFTIPIIPYLHWRTAGHTLYLRLLSARYPVRASTYHNLSFSPCNFWDRTTNLATPHPSILHYHVTVTHTMPNYGSGIDLNSNTC